jgi:hypothetical protein
VVLCIIDVGLLAEVRLKFDGGLACKVLLVHPNHWDPICDQDFLAVAAEGKERIETVCLLN